MGVIKDKDIVCWMERDGSIICKDCYDGEEATPQTGEDFEDGDVITCDKGYNCEKGPVR